MPKNTPAIIIEFELVLQKKIEQVTCNSEDNQLKIELQQKEQTGPEYKRMIKSGISRIIIHRKILQL